MEFKDQMQLFSAYFKWIRDMEILAGAGVSVNPHSFLTWLIETEEGRTAQKIIADETKLFLEHRITEEFCIAAGAVVTGNPAVKKWEKRRKGCPKKRK